ncbi:MAG: SusC/RagA family TonB-linked outer membrane protein [Candidatus Cyclobacteriaceae bacterium M3_2C_046]
MKKGLLLTLLMVLFTWEWVKAQDRNVTGTVTEAAGNAPVPGVNIVLKGTSVGTVTDVQGDYTINVPASGGVLVFSFIGYETRELEVGNRSVLDVSLSSDVKQLNEVVVTAMGIEREQKALGYAIQEVQAKDITAASQPNIANALQGKVAGVIVRQSSGMPGASSFITIRGSNAFDGNNQPLYVVDGMPIESRADADFSGGVSGTDATSRSLDINPEDIASINILKGPAAAALYGLRASNGVVVITTKRGQNAEGKANISVSLNYTADEVSRTPDIQNTYAQGSGGNFNQGTSLSWGPRISEMDPYELRPGGIDASILNRTQQPRAFNNVEPFFQTGGTFNGNIDLSGRTDNARYAIGLGYTNQDGFVPTTGMERRNAKLAGDFDITRKLTVGASANYSDVVVDKIAGGSNLSNPLFTTYFAPVSYDLWGIPFAYPDNAYRQIHYRGAMDNPRWGLANNSFNEQNRRIFGNTYFNYKPFEFLSVNYRIGVDYFLNDGKEVYGLGSGGTGGRTSTPSGGQIYDFSISQSQINSNLSLNFNKRLGENFGINAILGNEVYDIRQRTLEMEGNGIAIGGFDNINNTSSQVVAESQQNERVVGFYGQLDLDYRNMLFLTLTGRNDIVSNMPAENRSFFYPSVGGSFVFTEAFSLPQNVISFGKIRSSWAQVGQAGPLYATRNIFIQGGSTSGFLSDDLQFPFNGLNGFTQSNILRSADLEPQNTNTWEVGFDLRFFNDRLGIDYTYYNINATGQIFEVPLAPTTGFTSELRNAGEMNTQGHEIVLTAAPLKSPEGFNWNITTNFTSYTNEVISLAEGVDNIFLGGFVVPNVRAQAGSEYPIIFGSGFLRDENNNIIVLDDPDSPFNGMPIEDPQQKEIGRVQPDFEIGFLNTFSFKGFTLFAQIDWRQGGQMYAGNTRLAKLYGMDAVTEDRESDYVFPGVKGSITDINPDGSAQFEVTGDNDIVIQRSETYWRSAMDAIDESNIYETTFVRFRELSLSYNFPRNLVEKMNLVNLSLSLVGRNLFLWTDYPNFDPETSTGGASNFQGLEYVALPQIRNYGATLRFTF